MSPSGFTSFSSLTPFSFSISISYRRHPEPSDRGLSSQPPQHHNQRQETEAHGRGETHIPQIFVIGAFFAIFCAQVGVNFLHAVRNGRRRRRFLEMQFPHPLPQRDQVQIRANAEPPHNPNAGEGAAGDNTADSPVPANAPSDE
ncbi:hypothetical protein N7452_001933 [Penicillium brevicompactum]|uniref:Transmembrane protein n=1 Tax=Penicillium brevicompactum TaxID=5074 RepID=A0A9W9UQL9_PENBR|nr:hypothetical protein N7452_001933 [Penicillium brevicompactum]